MAGARDYVADFFRAKVIAPRLLAAVATVALAVGLVACGGSDSTTSSDTTTAEATAPSSGRGSSKQGDLHSSQNGGSGTKQGGNSGGSGEAAVATPLKVSGGGAGQFRTKGGDNSIQNYGEESDESELREAAEAVHGFYLARAEEKWAKACSYLTKTTVKQFEALASRSPQLKGEGCASVLHALTRPLPPSIERETTLVNAASMRRDGERAFLIYRGAENKPYAVPMQEEGGAWKVGGLVGTPLY